MAKKSQKLTKIEHNVKNYLNVVLYLGVKIVIIFRRTVHMQQSVGVVSAKLILNCT